MWDQTQETLHTVQLALRVGRKTGLLRHFLPRTIPLLLQALVRGNASPSTVYRLQAKAQPRKVALLWRHRSYTFQQIDNEIDRLAEGLHASGLRPGDRAILLLKNRPELIFAQPALSRLGAAGVSMSWRSTPAELSSLAQHCGAKALLFDHDVAPTVRDALPQLPWLGRDRLIAVGGRVQGFPSYEGLIATRAATHEDASGEAAVIVYTSGTTGHPKAAVRRFPRAVVQGTLNVVGIAPLHTSDIHLAVLPFYHSTAFAFTSFSHLVGAKVVILEEFSPENFLRAVQEHRITQTAVVPTMLHRLCRFGAEQVRRFDTSSLRAIISAGAPLSGPLALETMELFGDILHNFYGATETGLNTMAGPAELRRSPGTIGRVVPGNDVLLLNEQGQPVAQGEVGELYARSGLMVTGYLRDDAATRACQREGYFSVGDLAKVDEEGCYHLVGRKHDMVISGGVNVYPAEIEAVLEAHPAVAEAAVVGMPDEEWGERVRAFVVAREGKAEELRSLDTFCRARLMGPKVPREYVVLPALPRNPTGKVLKTALRAQNFSGVGIASTSVT